LHSHPDLLLHVKTLLAQGTLIMADEVRSNQNLQDRGLTPLYSTGEIGDSFAIVNRKLDSSESQTTQASQACYDRLRPITFGNRIGLSVGGRIAWKCSQCAHPWVRPTSTDALTIWRCVKCNAPRLARRQKSDNELISGLLNHPELKGWEKLFTREMQRKERLSTCQREKLQGIAKRLGIRLEENCSLSNIEGGES